MNAKRLLLVVLVLSTFVLVTNSAFANRKLVVASWGWAQDEVKYFDEMHPDIDVQQIIIPNSSTGYVEKITAMYLGGSLPDVLWVKPDIVIPPLVKSGMLEDLRKWAKRTKGFDLGDFFPAGAGTLSSLWDIVPFIPYTRMPYPLYYDRDVIKQAGLAEPHSGWTFSDFRSILKKVTRRDANGKVQLYGYDDIGRSWPFFAHKGPAGKRLFDDTGKTVIADNPQTIKGYEFFHSLIWEDGTMGGPGVNARMRSGRSAMSIWGPGAYPDRVKNGEVGLVSLPVGPGGYAPFVLVEGWAMSATSKNKEDAWDFITWMTGPEVQKRLAVENQGAPGNIPIMIENAFAGHPYRDVLIEIVTRGRQYQGTPLGTEVPYGVLREASSKLNVGAYWRNEKSLQAVIDEAVPAMQSAINHWLSSEG